MRRLNLLLASCLLAGTVPAFGHHNECFEPCFDKTKALTLKGAVKQVDLMIPHSFIYLNVASTEAGKPAELWRLEFGPTHLLKAQGITKETFTAGMELTVVAMPMKPAAVYNPDGRHPAGDRN